MFDRRVLPQEQRGQRRSWPSGADQRVTRMVVLQGCGSRRREQPHLWDGKLETTLWQPVVTPPGDGVYALKPKSDKAAYFRHIRSDIT